MADGGGEGRGRNAGGGIDIYRGLRESKLEGRVRDVPAGWEAGFASSSALDWVERLDL